MNRRVSLYLILSLSAMLLPACSSAARESSSQAGEGGSASSQQIAATAEGGSPASESAQTDTAVSYNGSYYSVQGKYGEVLVVNKHYPLAASYNPGEDATAKSELLRLMADMQTQGYDISDQYSGFRSYDTQASLYQNYVSQDGQAAADRYSARPGYSEHQTGLAFDLIDRSGNLVQEARASQWLLEHAHQYGFIVRYQEGKEGSTGYMPESWHLRYIGQEAADIAASGQSLEEYYGITGGDYPD